MNHIQAEQAVIGAVMLTGRAATFHAVADILRPDDFVDKRHGLLWTVFAELVQRDSPIDAVTVAEWVASNGIGGLTGSDSYILDLANNTPSAASIRAYAEIVAERARLREVRRIGASLAACPENATAAEIAAKYTSELLAIAGRRSQTVVTWREAVRSAWTELEESYRAGGMIPGSLLTPWQELNRIMIAMRPADFVVLAGRPGMGKTAVALNMILHAAAQVRVMMFSLEMSAQQLAIRGLAMGSGTPIRWLRDPGQEKDRENEFDPWAKITGAVASQRDLRLMVDQDAGLTADQVFARTVREHERDPLGLVVIDHMHLIDLGQSAEVRHAGANMTRTFKRLAKRLNCPVIGLAQLNRSVEQRADKRPGMADLREFGSIEQDADSVVFCYRDEYYNPNTENPGDLELIVAKNRDGGTGTAHVRFEAATNAVTDHAHGWAVSTPQPKKEQSTPRVRSGFQRGGQ